MEQRKIIKFGNSSYVLTLPFDWVKRYNLDKEGSYLSVSEKGTSLLVSQPEEKKEKRAIVDIENKPLKIVNREIISYYLKNYDFIEIRGKDMMDNMKDIKIIKEKLSSVEIVEINKTGIVLKDLSSKEDLKCAKLVEEIIEMEKIIFDELITLDEKAHYLITTLDSNINKLSFLAYKALNYNLDSFSDPSTIKDTIHFWRIISSLEHIGDKMKRIARYLGEHDNKEQVKMLSMEIEGIKEYFIFVTALLDKNTNLKNNLELALDKKQSLLMSFEKLRDSYKDELTLYLVVTQLFKDLLGEIENIVLSIMDIKNK